MRAIHRDVLSLIFDTEQKYNATRSEQKWTSDKHVKFEQVKKVSKNRKPITTILFE